MSKGLELLGSFGRNAPFHPTDFTIVFFVLWKLTIHEQLLILGLSHGFELGLLDGAVMLSVLLHSGGHFFGRLIKRADLVLKLGEVSVHLDVDSWGRVLVLLLICLKSSCSAEERILANNKVIKLSRKPIVTPRNNHITKMNPLFLLSKIA